jgi:hypothetical protein
MKKYIIISILIIFFVCSCSKKTNTIDSPPVQVEGSNDDLSTIELPAPEDFGGGSFNITFSKLLVNRNNFKHIYQKTTGITCGGSACLPTSYMIARAIVYPNRAFSVRELNNIIEGMGTVCGTGTGITKCQTYAKNDIGTCNPSIPGTTDREIAKKYIKDNLQKGLPVISLVRIKAATSPSSSSYLSESTGFGHFVTIVGLELTTNGTGSIVYYFDPLDKTGVIREANYTTFLNSCLAGSSANLYNIIGVGCEVDVPTSTNDIDKNMLVYWSFDNNNGSDESGNQNNAYNTTGFSFIEGVNGTALNKTNMVGYTTSFYHSNAISMTNEVSFSFWLKRYNNNSGNTFSFLDILNENTSSSVQPGITGSTNQFYFGYSSHNIYTEATLFNDNNYHHIVVNVNNDKIDLYIDGQLKNSLNPIPIVPMPTSLKIGLLCNGNASIDQFRIYNKFLSVEEISKLYVLKK